MPDAIRITVEGSGAHPPKARLRASSTRYSGFRAAGTAIAAALGLGHPLALTPAGAEDTLVRDASSVDLYIAAILQLDRHELVALALTLGILCFAVVTAILLVRTRRRLDDTEAAARDESIAARASVDRAYALLLSEPQILIDWAAASDDPEIIGDPSLITGPDTPHRVLAFGTWLEPDKARDMERSVDALRARGISFATTVTTLSNRIVEAEGQIIGGRAILRLREVSGIRYELAELSARHQKYVDDTAALGALIEALPSPVWTRDNAGKLVFVNSAYARAVEAKDAAEAVERVVELFDRAARTELLRAHEAQRPFAGRLPAVAAGNRRNFDVITVPAAHGSAGIGIDATEADLLRAELKRMIEAHRRILDQLTTGVAIFGSNQKLSFYNSAYRSLWELDAGFLDQAPTDSAVLDQLRAARKLPDDQDFRQWKAALHEAYRAIEPKSDVWHLPSGRTMRVVTTPNPEGGVIYLFDDVTERLDLERRFDALIRVQGETLDNLAEAVAVFGSDGRLRLQQSGVRPHVAARPRAARPAAAYRDRQRLVPAAARR